MKSRWLFSIQDVTLLLYGSLFAVIAQADQTIRFAPLPLEDIKIIHEQFRGLSDYLQETTGYTLEWIHLSDYADIIDRFKANEIDLAYLGPLPYVILKRDYPAAESIGCFKDEEGQTNYTCSLITWGENNLAAESITNATIGLTQPYSTCGYLSVSQMLAEAGRKLDGDGNSFSYAGSHSAAALGVARGEYDVAGVKTTIAKRYEHLNTKIIATSRPYPGFALVANKNTLNKETFNRLKAALLKLNLQNNPELQERITSWGKQIRNGIAPPQECDYKNVSDALHGLPWPIPGSNQ